MIVMTIWSIPLTGTRGKRPWDEDWKMALRSSYQLLCKILIQIIDRGTLFTDSELLELENKYKEKFPE